MRFRVDAQLPPALAGWLATQGHEAEHVADREMEAAPDMAIWRLAMHIGAVILTKDEDFARLRMNAEIGSQIVWIRLRNLRRADLLRWIVLSPPAILAPLDRGEALIEIV